MSAPPTIKAIPTKYKGIEFRSRLEARWAVFLDELGIEWQYEAEGYQLPSGWYVPDFWIPHMSTFLEIKPSDSEWVRPEFCELVEATGMELLVTRSSPGVHDQYGVNDETGMADFRGHMDENGKICAGYDAPYFFCQCPLCGAWGAEFDGRAERIRCCKENDQVKDFYTAHHANRAAEKALKKRFW